jgi:serine/threonine protein kinase
MTDDARVGPFRLLEVLGRGGQGTVYLAEQSEPMWRRVALKVMNDPVPDREGRARFEAERQALALMNHSNIAKVLETGVTADDGRLWIAMELVEGLPITEYCERRKLGLPERLRLFAEVCRGVQYAHQKAVVHRDLKPSNVLVA